MFDNMHCERCRSCEPWEMDGMRYACGNDGPCVAMEEEDLSRCELLEKTELACPACGGNTMLYENPEEIEMYYLHNKNMKGKRYFCNECGYACDDEREWRDDLADYNFYGDSA